MVPIRQEAYYYKLRTQRLYGPRVKTGGFSTEDV